MQISCKIEDVKQSEYVLLSNEIGSRMRVLESLLFKVKNS